MTLEEAMQGMKNPSRKKKLGGCIILGCIILIIVLAVVISQVTKKGKQNVNGFDKDFSITWAKNHTRISHHGERLELILDAESGMLSISMSKHVLQIPIPIEFIFFFSYGLD